MALSRGCCQKRRVKLSQIRRLVTVSECGGLRAAADELGVSRPALMRSIRSLEQELGTVLFKRAGDSMTLTPVGETFVRRVAAAQTELDLGRDEIRQAAGSFPQVLAVGMTADSVTLVLPKVLKAFQARCPEVRLRIVEGPFAKVEREVREGVLELYVGSIPPSHPVDGLQVQRLEEVAWVVVGRNDHPLASATSLADLADARWIAEPSSSLDPLFEQSDLSKPTVVVEIATGPSMLATVAESDALLILSASWLPLIEQTGRLTTLRLSEPLDGQTLHVVTRAEPPPSPAGAYLRDLILATAPCSHERSCSMRTARPSS